MAGDAGPGPQLAEPAPLGEGLCHLTLADAVAAWDASPALVVVAVGPPRLTMRYQNPASRRRLGPRPLGVPLFEALPELPAAVRDDLHRVCRDGVSIVRTADAPTMIRGEPVLLDRVLAPLGGSVVGRPVSGVVLTAFDVTLAGEAAEQLRLTSVLADLTERMNAAEDPDRALGELTATLVPAVADAAAVVVLRPEHLRGAGEGRAVHAPVGTAPAALTVSTRLRATAGPPPPVRPRAAHAALRAAVAAGRPVLLDPTHPHWRLLTGDDAAGRWLRRAGGHGVVLLPLLVAGELAGVVVLLAAGPRRPYRERDLTFLQEAATRAGTAVAHLRSFDRQRRVALDLQRALLPQVPSALPGLRVAARYVAGSAGVDVGGDWWDVQALDAERTGVGVGDVAGRGLAAAVVMGQARAAMHALAHAGEPPGRLLALLDAQLVPLVSGPPASAEQRGPSFATAAYAVVDLARHTVRVANAGHPPLLVRHPDGRCVRVQAPPGLPLGLGEGAYEELVVDFPPGATLVAFSDGLVEGRRDDIDAGIGRLESVLAVLDPGSDVERAADVVLTEMGRLDGHDDDVALLLVCSLA